MLVLLGIGFVAGVVTALSPCVLPVLPIVLAGGATGRRPLAIIAGLIGSFTVFTLGAGWLLSTVGLPDDLLRTVAIVLLFVVAATLLVPAVGDLVTRPFARLGRRPSGDLGGGVLLGASLGLVFVPCAGPVLAAITVLTANGEVGLSAVLLTLAYAAGAAVPLLVIALLGQGAASRLRAHATTVRRVSGIAVAGAAVAMTLGVDRDLQTRVPGYTSAVQNRFEDSAVARSELRELTGARAIEQTAPAPEAGTSTLPVYGDAPEFVGIRGWLNSDPLTLAALRGKVVLIDFWTYSCVNCLRTLPHVRSWDERYRSSGLVIVGVHTPEFAFERVPENVRSNARRLGVAYPVALDPGYGTWNAWGNRYWPAKFLIDAEGRVRYAHFGEGEYDVTEEAIRSLLADRGARPPSPGAGEPDLSPTGKLTPESYLGYERLARYAGGKIRPGRVQRYLPPVVLADDELAYGGSWTVEGEHATAGPGARILMRYTARDVYLVVTGKGRIESLVDGKREAVTRIAGDRLYTLVERPSVASHHLELRFTPGLAAYAFTFG